MKALLFDCDGTLADSFGTICAIMAEVFVAYGRAVPERRSIEAIIGLSLEDAMLRLDPAATEVEASAMAETYREIFRARRSSGAIEETLFAGIKKLIDDLCARDDVLLGMVTGKSRRGVDSICRACGLEGRFTAVRTADDCPSKPHPAMVSEACAELGLEPTDALVIGDSVYDMEMARAAGASALGVAWGSFTPETLRASGAFAVAETVPDLARRIEEWLGAPAVHRKAEARCHE